MKLIVTLREDRPPSPPRRAGDEAPAGQSPVRSPAARRGGAPEFPDGTTPRLRPVHRPPRHGLSAWERRGRLPVAVPLDGLAVFRMTSELAGVPLITVVSRRAGPALDAQGRHLTRMTRRHMCDMDHCPRCRKIR